MVHDVDEAVFRTFLLFLYGEPLDTPTLPTEEVIELLAIADRYEAAELRGRCEGVLVQRVKDANVFLLLEVADRYSARKLRVREHITCYSFLLPCQKVGNTNQNVVT